MEVSYKETELKGKDKSLYEAYGTYGKLNVFLGAEPCGCADLTGDFLSSARSAAARALHFTRYKFDLVPGMLASKCGV